MVLPPKVGAMTPMAIRLTPEQHTQLRVFADHTGWTRAELIRHAIDNLLAKAAASDYELKVLLRTASERLDG